MISKAKYLICLQVDLVIFESSNQVTFFACRNAALQCVANTKMLSQYFNSNCHLFELNRDNPLGFKGHIAKRFGDLVREMWSPNAKAIAPIKLRWTIGRYSSNFSGFQQQDSQVSFGIGLPPLYLQM